MARARRHAEKALELDPDLSLAHTSMALVRMYADWDFARADEQHRRAVELDPGSVIGHLQYAILLAYTGRIEEAIAHMEKKRDLDPLSSDPAGVDLGRLYEVHGEPERAVATWKETVTLTPDYVPSALSYGDFLCRSGRTDEAIGLLERVLAPERPWAIATLAYCHAISGGSERARALLAGLEGRAAIEYVTPVALALVHVGLGETDAAFAALERAYELHSLRILSLDFDPRWEPLRSDPRYRDLVERIGLPLG